MASPVKPSEVEALLITEGESFCSAFKKLLKSYWLTYKMVKYLISDAGGISTDWETDICAAANDCEPGTTTPEVTIPPVIE